MMGFILMIMMHCVFVYVNLTHIFGENKALLTVSSIFAPGGYTVVSDDPFG